MSNTPPREEAVAWLERSDGTVFWLGDQCTIGRSPDCQFRIDHPTVGRKHAIIERMGSEYRITDQNAVNGTRVNAHRANPSLPLHDHDVIQLSVNVAAVFRRHHFGGRGAALDSDKTVLAGEAFEGYLLVVAAAAALLNRPGGVKEFITDVGHVVRRHGGKVESLWDGYALCVWKSKTSADNSALVSGIELLQLPSHGVARFLLHYGSIQQYQCECGQILVGQDTNFAVAAAGTMGNEAVGNVLTDASVRALGLLPEALPMKPRAVAGFNDQWNFYTLGREFKSKATLLGRRGIVFLCRESPVFFGLSRAVIDDERFQFLGTSPTLSQAIQIAQKHTADLIVADLSLPADMIVLVQDVANFSSKLKMIGVLSQIDVEQGLRALKAGYKGLLLADDPLTECLTAIHSVLLGNVYVSPRLPSSIHISRPNGPLQNLADREREVFRLMGIKMSNTEIGEALSISVKTVEAHIRNIATKLKLSGGTPIVRQEAENWAKNQSSRLANHE